MISERKLCMQHTSFWRQTLPLSEAFVRSANLARERFERPLESSVDPDRRALVNETGFKLFAENVENGSVLRRNVSLESVDALSSAASSHISHLRASGETTSPLLDPVEKAEAAGVAEALLFFFATSERGSRLKVSPRFPGCGVLRQCEGDVLAGRTLYEIKAGDRDFRSMEFRQLLVYCTLNHLARAQDIEYVAVLNPRLGIYFKTTAEDLVESMSGKRGVELYAEIIDFISATNVSS